jgi:hypothetical protein
MTSEQIRKLANPALRRLGQNNRWAPAPGNPKHVYVKSREVHEAVRMNILQWGNRCRSFVVKTDPNHPKGDSKWQ